MPAGIDGDRTKLSPEGYICKVIEVLGILKASYVCSFVELRGRRPAEIKANGYGCIDKGGDKEDDDPGEMHESREENCESAGSSRE